MEAQRIRGRSNGGNKEDGVTELKIMTHLELTAH